MLTYLKGDIFSSPAQVLVNTVNTVGVMGKGIALEFKKRYPEMFDLYKLQCEQHKLTIGRLMLWFGMDHWVLQFPTKEHWRYPSKLEYIEKGLQTFVDKFIDYNITSIAFPKLGCGNGDLNWSDVQILMEKYLTDLPIDVYVYLEPENTMKEEKNRHYYDSNSWLLENAKDMSFYGLKESAIYATAVMPKVIYKDGCEWQAFWKTDNNLIFESAEERIELDEERIHYIWDYVYQRKIVRIQNRFEIDLALNLCEELGYLQPVDIVDVNGQSISRGYQLDQGRGRVFLARGILNEVS